MSVFESIFSSVEAFVYRCRNDDAYTMESIQGALDSLTGYDVADMIDNKVASWVGITSPKDVDRVFAEVDDAIEKKETWDTAYRVVHRDGHDVWVRERGSAVYESGKLAYLQGLIVGAAAERQLSSQLEEIARKTAESNREIVSLSEKIASSVKQLSMLSVNARIEAARSGNAGLGFAVVADEMKALANENGRLASIISEKLADARSNLPDA